MCVKIVRYRVILAMVIALLLWGGQTSVNAEDRYMGVYYDGTEAYLVTDSITERMLSHNGYFDGYQYNCKVKAVYKDTCEYYYNDYMFVCNTGIPYWIKDGVRTSLKEVYNNDHYAVEKKILQYFYDYSQRVHKNQWSSEKVLH